MKYRVKTDVFSILEEGEIIDDMDKHPLDSGNFIGFYGLIKRNPDWFDPVTEWEATRKGMSDEYFVKKNEDMVSGVNFYFTKEQAEAIANGLNELEATND